MIELQNIAPNACIVTQEGAEFFFSYQTCIAYRNGGTRIRRENSWGPTTGKHFQKLGCADFTRVSEDVFEQTISTR